MSADNLNIVIHLVGALFAGALIGLERSFRGRPAGFRTHSLVCLASSLLMTVTFYQFKWLPEMPMETIRADPARMAQGIMTGIGFLGAGVIFKEGLSVRGLTTAASIWITAAIGILVGIGFYFPAIVATALTIGTLSIFRIIEDKMPSQSYIHHQISFDRNHPIPEEDLLRILNDQGFTVSNVSYRVTEENLFEYHMILRTQRLANVSHLADKWRRLEQVRDFRIFPTGD